MDLEKARKQITANVAAQALYMKTIDDAEKKLSEDFVEIPYEFSIRLGMIDHYRRIHPDTKKSDIDILIHIENLFDKYDDDIVGVRDFNVDLDEVIISLDAITDIKNISDIIHVVNSILISSGSTQKMKYYVETSMELSKIIKDVKEKIEEEVRPLIAKTDS